jgi:hypothetical protein
MQRRGIAAAGWKLALLTCLAAVIAQHAAGEPREICSGDGSYAARDRHGPSLFGKSRRLRLDGHPTVEFGSDAPSALSPPPAACDALAVPEVCACRHAILVQSGNRAPSAAALSVRLWAEGGAERLRNVTDSLSLLDMVYVINSAYAWLHGHGYVFARVSNEGGSDRHPSWAKIPLLKHLAHTCSASKTMLYLDCDAYIRALDQPLRTQWVRSSTRTFAFSPECGWFSTAAGGRNAILDMATHQRSLDGSDVLEGGGYGLLNAGVVAMLRPAAAPSFLDAWWNASGAEKTATAFPWEQPAVTAVLQSDANRRQEIMLLDPAQFNGPDGHLIRHLYGGLPKQKFEAMRAARVMTDVDETLLNVARRVSEKGPLRNSEAGAGPEEQWHALMPDFRY